MRSLLIGNLTLDENTTGKKTYKGPGGSVYFLSKTFENLGTSSVIVSPTGKDFPQRSLSKTIFIPDEPLFEKTLKFKNQYSDTKRIQQVENYKEYMHFNITKETLISLGKDKKYDTVFIASVIDNLDPKNIEKILNIFSASFCFHYLKYKKLKQALVFANASAGLSLRYKKNKLQYRYKDIINFIREQKRPL